MAHKRLDDLIEAQQATQDNYGNDLKGGFWNGIVSDVDAIPGQLKDLKNAAVAGREFVADILGQIPDAMTDTYNWAVDSGSQAQPSAGLGPMAPGGPTVTPGFASTLHAAASDPSMTAEALDEIATLKLFGVDYNKVTARYGKWIGEGWSGASEQPNKVGAMPPDDALDALDALGQAHDFAYAAAEDAGKLYGDAEKYRLLALADEVGYRAWQKLDKNPTNWNPPAKNPVEAAKFKDRFPFVMRHQAFKHENARKRAPLPTPEQAAALTARGPVTAADLSAEASLRVQAWNEDKGKNMRVNNAWE